MKIWASSLTRGPLAFCTAGNKGIKKMTLIPHPYPAKWLAATGLSLALTLVLAACGAPDRTSPTRVAANTPSVVYEYQSDQDLIQANQRSVTFCEKYDAIPITTRFDTDSYGTKTIYFDCAPKSSQSKPLPEYVPNLAFTYTTDRELMAAARNAQIYCMNSGARQVFSNIVVNDDTSRTVVFQCMPR